MTSPHTHCQAAQAYVPHKASRRRASTSLSFRGCHQSSLPECSWFGATVGAVPTYLSKKVSVRVHDKKNDQEMSERTSRSTDAALTHAILPGGSSDPLRRPDIRQATGIHGRQRQRSHAVAKHAPPSECKHRSAD